MGAIIQDIQAPQYAMSGNPVVVSARNAGDADGLLTVAVSRSLDRAAAAIFTGSYTLRAGGAAHYFDVGEVVKSAMELPPLPSLPSAVVGAYGGGAVTLYLYAGDSFTQRLSALYGQLPSGELLRRGCSAEALIAEKLVEQASNPGKAIPAPFFSVRSRAYTVNLYEAELTPLFFMSRENFLIRVMDADGAQVSSHSISTSDAASGLSAFYLNLAPLVTPHRKYFRVVFGDNHARALHVTLSPNPAVRALRTVTFLNSLGFYEKLLLTGEASRTRSFAAAGGDEAGATRQELVPPLQLYRKLGVRRDAQDSITLMAGYATADRLAVVADMVNSERILLDGEPVVCTTSELATRSDADLREPREVELTFMVAE
jgi:hypothetical protein